VSARGRSGIVAWLLLATLSGAAPLAAQAPADTTRKGPPPPPTELILEREVFQYPTYQRRNPFRPLVGALAGGPRFEQIRLRGIIWSANASQSIALFGVGDAGSAAAAAAAAAAAEGGSAVANTKRLRIGESWGNMRVVEIQRDRVVVSVEDFGLTERKVLELTRRRAEGGQ
jgi:hypothetical protein